MTDLHTPGPWEAHQGVLGNNTIWDVTCKNDDWSPSDETPEGWFVATVHEVRDAASAEANARLIASAPTLLAIVKMLLKKHEAHHNSVEHALARAQLRLIRGEE